MYSDKTTQKEGLAIGVKQISQITALYNQLIMAVKTYIQIKVHV
jgi:hypothetical protein